MQVSTWKDTVTYKQTTTLPASLYTIQSAPLSNRIINQNQIKSKKNLYIAVYSADSEALGGRIKWGRRNDTD